MTVESQADFARRCNVSRKTVSEWKKAGRLVMQGDRVDVEASLSLMDRHRKGGAPSSSSAVTPTVTLADSGNSQGNKSSPKAIPGRCSETSAEEVTILPGETIEDAAQRLVGDIDMGMSFDEVRRLKEVYLVLLNRLEFEQKSGALIDLETASTILFEEFRAARDAWLNWPTRIGPMLAADLGIDADKVTTALSAYVHKQVTDLGDPQADFACP
ncbi:hypothetical protein [Pandoraea terrigena]|uniref:Uncharacterized protein n=1 Tax=Pandoraea terrigena TaxID=2508292 RepID=A0A5E4URZ0_9BURK|nr:hypothetical protein [Pandoraea terrigena]VVE01779.1 hypothetical protein PTE31013_02181 [Pandoraea terrigena]